MGTGRCRVVVRIGIDLHWRWIGCRTTRIGNHHHNNHHRHRTGDFHVGGTIGVRDVIDDNNDRAAIVGHHAGARSVDDRSGQ